MEHAHNGHFQSCSDIKCTWRMDALQLLLESYAPKIKDRAYVRGIYNKMIRNEETPEVIEKQIVIALNDGLRYGNWPWSPISTLDPKTD